MRRERIAEAIRTAAWANPTGLRTTEGAASLADAIMEIVGPVSSEPTGVSLLDGERFRDESVWKVLDRGTVRSLRFTVARGHFLDDGPRVA